MIFEKKKIQAETLSEFLKSTRESFSYSEKEVCKITGIKLKFLQGLESGDFSGLPADVYVFGFLRQLARLYSTEEGELIGQYKKERVIVQQVVKQASRNSNSLAGKIFGRLVVTPKSLSLILGATFVVLSVSYIFWQVWSINRLPSLKIIQPLDNSVIAGGFVNLSGQTDPGITVSVNGQNLFVDKQGNFGTQVGLALGAQELTISATNRFGKAVSQNLNVTGIAATSSNTTGLSLKMDFTGPAIVSFTIDDQNPQTLDFNLGDSKTFTASQKILLSTSDAGATKISINGQSLGAMGRSHEALNNIPFLAQFGNIPSSTATASESSLPQ